MLNRTHLRPIERRDIRALFDIIRAARAEHALDRGPAPLEPAEADIYERYQARRTLYFVAVIGGEVVGGAGIAPLAGSDPLTCELQNMYLKPEARGQGVGALLLDSCLESARRFWYVRCYAATISGMIGALKLYSRNGFVELSGAVADTGHGHDHWLMRELKAPQESL
jgi:putative acetyltransferase